MILKVNSKSICPPILLLVFNRPETTAIVFNVIREAKPSRLYVASDGPREDRENESVLVDTVRKISTTVDWPCEVMTLFRDNNLGCKQAVSGAISWFFDHEQEGIVLEDDCVPHPDFFSYCGILLERYRDDDRIGFISGTSLCDIRSQGFAWSEEDYVYSRYPSVWGWASWRRVWNDYDASISDWKDRRDDITALTHHPKLSLINASLFDRVFEGKIDTWDYQVSFMLWITSRLAIAPRFNLVENIGFGPEATHTKIAKHSLSNLSKMHSSRLVTQLQAPTCMIPNYAYQRYIETLATRPFWKRLLEKIRHHVAY